MTPPTLEKIQATKKELAKILGVDVSCISVSIGENGVPHVSVGNGCPQRSYVVQTVEDSTSTEPACQLETTEVDD